MADDHYPYNSVNSIKIVATSRPTNDKLVLLLNQFGNVEKDGNKFIFLEDWVGNEYPETLNVS